MFEYQHVICPKCDAVVRRDSLQHVDEYGDECPITSFTSLEVIASWGICNTASLNVFKFSKSNDAMLVAINDGKPEWCEIENCKREDWEDRINIENEWVLGINFHGTSYFIDECMRCR